MALPTQQQEQKKSMAMAMPVPQLLTPDQPLSHSFVVSGPEPRMPSPPASPEFNEEATFQHKDDVLYPDHNVVGSTNDEKPLFNESQTWTTPEREQRSPTATSLSVSTPRSSISSQVQPVEPSTPAKAPVGPVEMLNTHGMEYWRYMMAQNVDLRARIRSAQRQLPGPQPSQGSARDAYSAGMVSSLGRARVEKPRRANVVPKVKTPKAVPAKPAARSQAPVATSTVDSPPPRRNRRKTATPDPSLGGLPHAAQPKPRTRAAPTKKIDSNPHADWHLLPDYCPPTSSLDTMSKKMTTSWTNSNPLNLDNDPDRKHLHPQELAIASVLRLPCNRYLGNKRRIFAARLRSVVDGKDFNKTSAQNATNIDVNKSSKLWEAFDSVGWFDKHWFEQHL